MGPNLGQLAKDVERNARAYERANEQDFREFVARGDRNDYARKIQNIQGQIDQAIWELERSANANLMQRDVPVLGLWSVGMNAQKTQAVNQRMMKVASDAMLLGADPVYGPFIQQQQALLMNDLQMALMKYDQVIQTKMAQDPVFASKLDNLVTSGELLDQELENPAGYLAEDNDGSLQKAAAQWNQI